MAVMTVLPSIMADWGDHHMGGDSGSMWIWVTLMIVFWVTVIGLGIWLITRSAATRTPSGVERAQAILAERLARGEISPEEYRTTLTHLQ